MEYTKLRLDRVTPMIGAEVSGLDLAQPLDEATFVELQAALMERQVLFFRNQQITLEQQLEMGKKFGALHIHPAMPAPEGYPEVMVIETDENSTLKAGNFWHSDVSCDEEPPLGTILHMHVVPASGGDTLFASMTAAYQGLSQAMQRFLDGLTALHESEQLYRGRYAEKGVDDSGKIYPSAVHPVVRTHPVTGEKCLYVNETFTTRIRELGERESRAVLTMLFEHIKSVEFQCRFKWQEKSIAFWDNRCTQHYAIWDYHPEVRRGFRVTIQGDKPF